MPPLRRRPNGRRAGYKYTFPFMSIDCGLTVDDNYVQPLYKHCININRPTMALIGLPYYVCASQMFDLQVKPHIMCCTYSVNMRIYVCQCVCGFQRTECKCTPNSGGQNVSMAEQTPAVIKTDTPNALRVKSSSSF